MEKKVLMSLFLVLFLGTALLKGQSSGNCVTDAILSAYSVKMFTTEPVKDSDLHLILKCGIKAPSARNSQLWKFTVVKDISLVADVIRNLTAGNVIIIVSGVETQQQGINIDFDCALATENMYLAAQSLGLGSHIYMGPMNTINTTMRETLGIPEGYKAVTILRIGNIDKSVDATSSASTRKTMEEIVNYK
jgi:nitroreductase